MTPDAAGVFQSSVFPGLYLDSTRFWADELAGLPDTLRLGLASPEHGTFKESLG